MTRVLVGLVLAVTLGAGFSAVAADDPPTTLTPAQRKELQARRKDLFSAGRKHYQTGKPAEAAEAFQKALAITRRLHPRQDHPDLTESLAWLALALQAQWKYAEAEPLYREALEATRRLHSGQDHRNLAMSLYNLASVLQAQDKDADAEPLFREGLEMLHRLYPRQDTPELANTMICLAQLLQGRCQYAEAETLAREALNMARRMRPGLDDQLVATSLATLADVLRDGGQPAQAEPLYREAVDVDRRLYGKRDHLRLSISLNNLGAVLHARGKYADAEPLYREVLEMRRRLFPRQDNPYLATSLNNLAGVLQAQGKYTEAEPLYRDAVEMDRRLYPREDHPYLATSLNNLAGVLQRQGKYVAAEPLYRQALDVTRRLHPRQDHPHVAQTMNNLAYVLQAQGRYDDAEPLFRDALGIYRRLHPRQDHPELAASLNNLANLLQSRGKTRDAEPLFPAAVRMYRALAGTAAAVLSEGEALTFAASQPAARDMYLSNAQALHADPEAVYWEVWASKANLARIYERRALAARAAAVNPRAADLLAQLTARRRRRADLLLAPRPADPATRKQRGEDVAACARDVEALDRDLRPLLPAIARAEKLAAATPSDLQKALPGDAAVVDFLRYILFEQDPKVPGARGAKWTTSYLAFVVTRDRVSWSDLGPAEPIEAAVAAWRQAITDGKDVPAALSARVRELVWARVRKELPASVKQVYLCPDLALCRVPWAALPGDKPNTILLEEYALATVPHAVFLLDKLWPQDAAPTRPTTVLTVGGVAYDAAVPVLDKETLTRGAPLLKSREKFAWSALPGAAAEAQGVRASARKKDLVCRTLTQEEATTATVLTALPRARFAHLATHGFFADASFRSAFQVDPDLFRKTLRGERIGAGALSPMVMTGLVFAGANQPSTPGRGIVTGEALVDVDLSGLELAVLSACETGLGDVAGGEGTFGLQRAFHLAGTRDVVASLWKVADRPTAALMALFYRNLWEKELPPIEALRQAQLEIYRHPERIAELAAGFRGKVVEILGSGEAPTTPAADGKAHPRLWAAFTLSGPGR
jgi:CHAT domain-containing protein